LVLVVLTSYRIWSVTTALLKDSRVNQHDCNKRVHRTAVCAAAPLHPLAMQYPGTVEHMLERLRGIRIDEDHHGRAGDRRFRYVPLYIVRGLQEPHLEFTAVS
jgi:hypothetical protein